MSLEEFSERLGVTFDQAPPTTPQPTPQKKNKVLSFLSDSCYLSSPLWFSGSDSEPESEPDLVKGVNASTGEARGMGDRERPGFLSAGSSSSSSSSLTGSSGWASPSHLPRNSSAASGGLTRELTTSAATSAVCKGLKHELSIATSGSEGLSRKFPNNHELCTQSCSSLARQHSLTRCDTTAANCSLAATGKTNKAHVSCPDFHSCSSDNHMEWGPAVLQEPEDMETASLEGEHHGVLGFDLLPLLSGPPDLVGSRNSPSTTTPREHSTMGDKFSPGRVPKGKNRSVGTKFSPVGGFENQANSTKSSQKKSITPTCRTPLQSLTNAANVRSSRQQGMEKQEKPVLSALANKPANFSSKY